MPLLTVATGRSLLRPVVAPSSLLTNLIAYWKLDEVSGTRIDSAGNNHLTSNNSVGVAGGIQGGAASFTAASTQYLSIADNAALSLGGAQDFTVAAWVYMNAKASNRCFVAKGNGAAGNALEYCLWYSSASDRFQFFCETASPASSDRVSANVLGIPATSTWYFIVGWHDSAGATVNIQVNDGTANSLAHTAGTQDTALQMTIGRISNLSNFYTDGRIDSVGLWKRMLTSAEKTYLYNGGKGVEYPF